MKYRHDPAGSRLPVKLDASSNGEFAPVPLSGVHHQANFLAHETADSNAKRLGLDRRSFLVSACGVAGSLLGMNTAYAEAGKVGGFFELDKTAALDLVAARSHRGRRVSSRTASRRVQTYTPNSARPGTC